MGPALHIRREENGLHVVTPLLPLGTSGAEAIDAQRFLLKNFLKERKIHSFLAWYYTPMALEYTSDVKPELVIYDCMDELSAFQGAPPQLVELERELFRRADLVFVGGQSLYHVKRKQHANVHCFPSSIDRAHFVVAREGLANPTDQRLIPHPRIGFFGVLDERLDTALLAAVAEQNPQWSLILLGPVVKIRPEQLPRLPNIHYLGQKQYGDLPAYLSNWDVAMLPFANNASTRFISPTKTPEYLAAGKRVVSTPIQDVIEPYGRLGLVDIAATPKEFSTAIESALTSTDDESWLDRVDQMLSHISWDKTFAGMWHEVTRLLGRSSEYAAGYTTVKEIASV
ncbi:glycosyltransferase [Acidisarcina polymorpha]|uniref:glycosyltransferase n=1 Tax=Acidisarcina polymorpha TaxID=2211140 RepID=UPI001F2D9D41|nr:glycosyltransferase [Acidisarcina polymorpha]